MKKFLIVFILCLAVIFCACDNQIESIVFNNMSDMRTNYFYGEAQGVFAELSSGVREEQFFYDGVSTNKVDCAVLSVGFVVPNNKSSLKASVDINGKKNEVILYHSPYEDLFMADLGRKVDDDSQIKLTVGDFVVVLKNKSSSWKVGYIQAIKTGAKNLQTELERLFFNGKLNAEGYLKIVYEREFNVVYWYFSIIDRSGKRYSLLIDVETGKVVESEK